MKLLVAILTSIMFFQTQAKASDRLVSSRAEPGFFSFGLGIGAMQSGLQNTSGNYSGYTSKNLAIDLSVRLLELGTEGTHLALSGSYLLGEGQDSRDSSNTLSARESYVGLKLGIGSSFYLFGGGGNNQLELKSTSSPAELKLSHTITKLGAGLEFAFSESFYWAIEGAYRTGSVKKSDNPSLVNNTNYEGGSILLKFIWSPPSIVNHYNLKK